MATATQNNDAAGGFVTLTPYPQHPPLQPTTSPQPAVLARQIAASDDATYVCEFKWKTKENRDTTKYENLREEVLLQQDLKVFGLMSSGYPYI